MPETALERLLKLYQDKLVDARHAPNGRVGVKDRPMPDKTTECPCCKGEPEPGWIETPNNCPIVPCWICNRERWLTEREQKVMRRALRRSVRIIA